jgi:hypothetical protein
VNLFNAAGRLVACFSGTGVGEVILNHQFQKLTTGIYAGQLDIGGVSRQARIAIE